MAHIFNAFVSKSKNVSSKLSCANDAGLRVGASDARTEKECRGSKLKMQAKKEAGFGPGISKASQNM